MAQYIKKVSVGAFAKKGVDINNGDRLTIANEGKKVEGQFGPQDVFLVKLANGEEKNLSFNSTSINGLIDAYGGDSMNWIGKPVKVWLVKQNVAGKFADVLYVSHPDADLTADGFVMRKERLMAKPKPLVRKPAPVVEELPEEEIEIEEEGDLM